MPETLPAEADTSGMPATDPVLPGSTIAILGGGHLGRLVALAGKSLGYRVHVLEGDASCTSEDIADLSLPGRLHDLRAVAAVVRDAHVVTTSVEQVPRSSLAVAAAFAPVRPGVAAVAIAQDREHERRWLEDRDVSVGAWRAADTLEDVRDAFEALGAPCYLKPRIRGTGDDGPLLLSKRGDIPGAWTAVRGRPSVVETVLPVDLELSVLVARSVAGDVRAFPPALSHRAGTRLQWSAMPAPVPAGLARKARDLACYIAARIDLEGLLAVELFLLRDGRLVVNELVPGAHATCHAADAACATGQFEQLVRAITGLPLGCVDAVRAAASAPLDGALWDGGRTPRFDAALQTPNVRLQLYGVRHPHQGQPMGHLCATAHSADRAVEMVLGAVSRLRSRRPGTDRAGPARAEEDRAEEADAVRPLRGGAAWRELSRSAERRLAAVGLTLSRTGRDVPPG